MILIDYRDRRPIYEQIVEKLQQMILCGAMKPNEPMPSVRSLAIELSLNPNTIQRAYQELERNGYIYTVKGKGSYVSETTHAADHKRQEIIDEMRGILQKVLASGIEVEEFKSMVASLINEVVSEKVDGGES